MILPLEEFLLTFSIFHALMDKVSTVVCAAKLQYNSILANVDWLHGSAESFLTMTNLFIGKQSEAQRGL